MTEQRRKGFLRQAQDRGPRRIRHIRQAQCKQAHRRRASATAHARADRQDWGGSPMRLL